MLDDHPILKERLLAAGAFSGIAVAAVAGLNLIITGGFDFAMPGREIRQVAPSAYVTVIDQPWASQTRYVPVSSNEPMFAGEDASYTGEAELAGADDDAPATAARGYPSADELYAQIEALYAQQNAEAAAALEEATYPGQTHDYAADEPKADTNW